MLAPDEALATGSGRASVDVMLGGRRVGAIHYDATLIADRETVESAGRVVAIALHNEQLTAELRAGRDRLQRALARTVEASDAERRRIARDLHDGLQGRLVLLAIQADAVKSDPALADDLGAGLQTAITELRGLVQGVMPAMLTERGLCAAVEELTARCPIPVALDLDRARGPLPGPVESTGYFIVAEALANAIKHAQASVVDVRLVHADGELRVEITRRRHRRRAGQRRGRAARHGRPRGRARRQARRQQPSRRRDVHPRGAAVRIVIGEDQALLREGLVLLLERGGFEVAGVAGDGEDLVRKARAHDPDLVIADVRMPPSQTDEGLRAALTIRESHPHIALVVLSQHVQGRYATELVESSEDAAGIGYLLKQRVADGDAFCEDLRRVGAGCLGPRPRGRAQHDHAARAPAPSPTSPRASATCSASWPRDAATPGSPSSSCCPRRPSSSTSPTSTRRSASTSTPTTIAASSRSCATSTPDERGPASPGGRGPRSTPYARGLHSVRACAS